MNAYKIVPPIRNGDTKRMASPIPGFGAKDMRTTVNAMGATAGKPTAIQFLVVSMPKPKLATAARSTMKYADSIRCFCRLT
jgi:hypothetical protein